jgi:perosamine synthetase
MSEPASPATGELGLAAVLGGSRAVTVEEPHFQWPTIDHTDRQAVLDLLEKRELYYYRLDGAVEQFENAFARRVGLPYAISAHSGTGAIHAGWFALDLPPGSEVVVPAYTHIGTVLPLLHLGLIPVLCDIDPNTGNLDPRALARTITPRSTAIAVTHQFGLSCPMDEICEIARRQELRILEDCSHAHGAMYRDRPVGVRGDVACFSLQAHKAVPVGEGGILLTANPQIAERAALLGHFRQRRSFTSDELSSLVETGYGLKSRLHPLAATLGLKALDRLDEVCAARRKNYAIFAEVFGAIPGIFLLPEPESGHRGGFFRFVLKVDSPDFAGLTAEQVVQAVQAEGAVEVHPGSLARPLHSYRIFQDPDLQLFRPDWHQGSNPLANRPVYRLGDFPGAEDFSANTIQMPAFTQPSALLIRQYGTAFMKVQKQAGEIQRVRYRPAAN